MYSISEVWRNWVVRLTFESCKAIGIDYVQFALESCKASDTCDNVRFIERKYSIGQKYLFKLRRCSSYGDSSNRVLLMRIYWEIFTMSEESFELRIGSSNRKSNYREFTVLSLDFIFLGMVYIYWNQEKSF